MDAKPFTIQQFLELGGGYLNKPIKISCEMVDGAHFTTLKKTDRVLAKAMGKDVSQASPFADCSIFSFMMQARNDKVDQMIKQALWEKDPLAESDPSAIDIQAQKRQKLFDECKIPQIIEVEFAAFVTPDGRRVEAKTVAMIATPMKRVSPCIQALPENFGWFLDACQHAWSEKQPQKRKRSELEDDLPHIEKPLRYNLDTPGRVIMYFFYRTENGVWKKSTRSIDLALYKDQLTSTPRDDALTSLAKFMKDLYNTHHVPPPVPEEDEEAEVEEVEEVEDLGSVGSM
jgi:hypothetical protein